MANHYLDNKKFEANIIQFQQAKREKTRFQLIANEILAAEARAIRKNSRWKRPESWQNDMETLRSASNRCRDLQDLLAADFHLLSENIINYAKLAMVDRDDAVQEGILICFETVDRFDPDRGSKAFNYMTTCIWNHFKQLYRTARNYSEFIRKYQEWFSTKMDLHAAKPNRKKTY